MAPVEDEANAYEILGVANDVAEGDLRKAYRQQSLKVHPDRHPNNPDAAHKFHELTQAYELLQDPIKRMALDASLRIKEARKTRFATYDSKRKVLQEELEESERAFKRQRQDQLKKDANEKADVERIKEEGRRLMREKKEENERKAKEAASAAVKKEKGTNEAPVAGPLDTTVRLKYPLASYPALTTPESLAAHLATLAPLSSIDVSSIVISAKPPKKNPTKPPKFATALIPFKTVAQAFGVVSAGGSGPLKDIDVTWAQGTEPEIVKWLKETGQLGRRNPTSTTTLESTESTNAPPASSSNSFSFSFDPSTAPEPTPQPPPPSLAGTGLDFESITLMRLRQAERERLEQEIREAED